MFVNVCQIPAAPQCTPHAYGNMAGKRKTTDLEPSRRSKRSKPGAPGDDSALEALSDDKKAVAQGEGQKWAESAYNAKKADVANPKKVVMDSSQATGDLDGETGPDAEEGGATAPGQDPVSGDASPPPDGDALPPVGDGTPPADVAQPSEGAGQVEGRRQPEDSDPPGDPPPEGPDGSQDAAAPDNELIKAQALLIEILERRELLTNMIDDGRARCVKDKKNLLETEKNGRLVTRSGRKAAKTARNTIKGFQDEMLSDELPKRKEGLGTLKTTLRRLVDKLTTDKGGREGTLEADALVDAGTEVPSLNACSLACEQSKQRTNRKEAEYRHYLTSIETQLQKVERYVRHQKEKAAYPPDDPGPFFNAYWDDDEGDDEQPQHHPGAIADKSGAEKHAVNDAERTPQSSDVADDDSEDEMEDEDGNEDDWGNEDNDENGHEFHRDEEDGEDNDEHDGDKDNDENEEDDNIEHDTEAKPEVSHNERIHVRALVPGTLQNAFLIHFNKRYNRDLDISNTIDAPVETILLYLAAEYHEYKTDLDEPAAESLLEGHRIDLHDAATEAKLQNYEVDLFLRTPGQKDEIHIIKALREYGNRADVKGDKVLKSQRTMVRGYLKENYLGMMTDVHNKEKYLGRITAVHHNRLRKYVEEANSAKTQQAQVDADERLEEAVADASSQGFTVQDSGLLQLFTEKRHVVKPEYERFDVPTLPRETLGNGRTEVLNKKRYFFKEVAEMPDDVWEADEVMSATKRCAHDRLSRAWKDLIEPKAVRDPPPPIRSIKETKRSSILGKGQSSLRAKPGMTSSKADEHCERRKYKRQFLEHMAWHRKALNASGRSRLDPEERFGDPSKFSGEQEIDLAQRFEGCTCLYCKVLTRSPGLIDEELTDRIHAKHHTLAGLLSPRDDEEGLGMYANSR